VPTRSKHLSLALLLLQQQQEVPNSLLIQVLYIDQTFNFEAGHFSLTLHTA
jgi:hypothetical protein